MRPLFLIPLLTLLPAVADAQSLTLNFTDSSTATQRTVGPASCGGVLPLTYSAVTGGNVCKRLEIWASPVACEDERGAAPLLASVSTADLQLSPSITNDLDVAVASLPLFGDAACADFTGESQVYICGSFGVRQYVGSECTDVQASSEPLVIFDAEPPPVPVVTDVTPLDSALRVTVDGSDYARLLADVKLAGGDEWIRASGAVTSGSGVTIPQLTNGVLYDVRVLAEDAALNVSEPSAIVQGMPVQTQGFWGDYKDSGGSQTGCSTVGGGLAPAALAALCALGLLRRRRS